MRRIKQLQSISIALDQPKFSMSYEEKRAQPPNKSFKGKQFTPTAWEQQNIEKSAIDLLSFFIFRFICISHTFPS